MALIEIKTDLERVASALERIALALERISPPPLPLLRSTPKPPRERPSPRPEAVNREILHDLIDQGVPEAEAAKLSELSEFELMKRGVVLDHDLADSLLDEDV